VKRRPAQIYLAARNEASAQKAIEHIETEVPGSASLIQYVHCDLASLASVQATTHAFLEFEKKRVGQPRLDLLFLNAGVMAVPAALTKDGYEIQFGTNHLGHFLLHKLLLPTLLATAKLPSADVRVISLTSLAHLWAPLWSGIAFESLHTSMTWTPTLMRYGQSKLANILFVKEVQRRYGEQGITAVAVHPGAVDTDLYRTVISTWWVAGRFVDLARRLIYLSVENGVKGQLWAATAPVGDGPHQVKAGEYYEPLGVTGQGSWLSNNAGLALKLWDWSVEEVEGYD
jgi:retinol dehydrogenase 12